MWLTPGRATGRKNVSPKLFMMAKLKRGHCTARSTATVKDRSGEGGQTADGLINDGVQPDVLQRGGAVMACRVLQLGGAVMACRRSKSEEVRAATWNVSSMVCRSSEVVDTQHRRKSDFCCAQETRWKCEDARCYWYKIQILLAGL